MSLYIICYLSSGEHLQNLCTKRASHIRAPMVKVLGLKYLLVFFFLTSKYCILFDPDVPTFKKR